MSGDKKPDLDAIEARLAKITKGQWNYNSDGASPIYANRDGFFFDLLRVEEGISESVYAEFCNENDGEFIARAPADIAALLARARQQDEKIAELEAVMKELVEVKGNGFITGAKETKERVLMAIEMAGLMETKFGDKLKARAIAEIHQLVQSIPIEIVDKD